ncbi:MAG: hypothetical protein QJT81_07580 [Candidatus Thiothrix putei]|uniref:Uncharacterized protein n=1 Tax=Candidatus Thiothrix putei TaxID=3080811 RepID=A0AA95KKP7_9GAMM|nr:MAG: hypothetical protein QJT81_07580 [Candidatus Thiothrix putei]
MPTDVKKLADLSDVISDFTKQKERFETVKTMTRVIGFEGLVNELQDDGHLNQSNSSTDASSLASVLQDVKPQGRLIPVKDASLRMCIAAALQTTPDAVSYNQLLYRSVP